MPKGKRTIHGIANEHITSGLAPVAAEQRQNILAREQRR